MGNKKDYKIWIPLGLMQDQRTQKLIDETEAIFGIIQLNPSGYVESCFRAGVYTYGCADERTMQREDERTPLSLVTNNQKDITTEEQKEDATAAAVAMIKEVVKVFGRSGDSRYSITDNRESLIGHILREVRANTSSVAAFPEVFVNVIVFVIVIVRSSHPP